MWRLVFWFIVVAALAWGVTWLAAHPGTVSIEWFGQQVEMPVALALALLLGGLLALWIIYRLLRMVIGAPFAIGDYLRGRRRRKAHRFLTTGLTALLAGDAIGARRAASKAVYLAPEEPMARLLQAQAMLLSGQPWVARNQFQQMLDDPQTEPAALHGLYELAVREGDENAARTIAEKAWMHHPDLPWAAWAVLKYEALDGEWPRVRLLLEKMRKAKLIGKEEERRLKAVAFAAEALALEEREPERALQLVLQAHRMDPALVPAAVVAGRLLAARGKAHKAARVLEKTWQLSPHVDIAEVYAHLGKSPRERLERVRRLLRKADGGEEGAVALARAAIDAQEWDEALAALKPWIGKNPSARIFLLLAELEEKRAGDIGRVREWLRRARTARPDPAWVAGSLVSPVWLPVTPEGVLGAFEWKEPPVSEIAHAALSEPVPAEWLEPPAAIGEEAQEEVKLIEAHVTSAEESEAEAGAEAGGRESVSTTGAGNEKEASAAGKADKADGGGERPAPAAAETAAAGKSGQERAAMAKAKPGQPVASPAEAVAELPEENFNRPPLPDDPGLPGRK